MEEDARSGLYRLILGFAITQAIGSAVRLGLPDLVTERSRTPAELAVAANADPDAVRRLLRALASLDVFAHDDEGNVVHTEMSRLLCREAPQTLFWQAMLLSGLHYPAWGDAVETFRTGEPAFPRVHGVSLWTWLGEHADDADVFNNAMTMGAAVRRAPLLNRDWSQTSTVVDVGGGTASTVIALLQEHPHLTGVAFDLPHAEEGASRAIEAAGLADRCYFLAGDFFQSVPPDADVYILGAILHDWDDDFARAILHTVGTALKPSARLLVLDRVIQPGSDQVTDKLMDLHMLVGLGGKERDEEEWRDLLAGAGLSVTHIEPGLIEAVPSV